MAAFATAFGESWPLLAFWVLTATRLIGFVLGRVPGGGAKEQIRREWGVGVALYVLAVGVATGLPVARLGISQAVIDDLAVPGSGLWIEQPQRGLAAGTLYFLCRTLVDVFGGIRPAARDGAGGQTTFRLARGRTDA